MSNIDFSPLFRSSIGFDRVVGMLENSRLHAGLDGWPPYDIARVGENDYRITVVVAGFIPDELSVTFEPNVLIVGGRKKAESEGRYLHRGIVHRGFQRRFDLADHVKVVSASLEHGLLTIALHRDLPEELKPRKIEIGRSASRSGRELPSPQLQEERHAA